MKPALAFRQCTWAAGFILPVLGCEETNNNAGGRSAGPNAWAGERSISVRVHVRVSVNKIIRQRREMCMSCEYSSKVFEFAFNS